jgi:hypothetical protein
MDFLKLDEQIMELIDGANFDAAEAELLRAKEEASNAADSDVLDHVFSLLVTVQRSKQPPDLAKAESYCLERERVIGTGYAKGQYAMTLYWAMDDPARTVAKAREAITASKREGDDKSAYQALGLLGLALLDTHQDEEAHAVLDAIQVMVSRRPRIVVGDETLFLERLRSRAKDTKTLAIIRDLARRLWPVCRDQEFKARLQRLTEG